MDIEALKKLVRDILLAFVGSFIFIVIWVVFQVVPVLPGLKDTFYFIVMIFIFVTTIDAVSILLEPFGINPLFDSIKEYLEWYIR